MSSKSKESVQLARELSWILRHHTFRKECLVKQDACCVCNKGIVRGIHDLLDERIIRVDLKDRGAAFVVRLTHCFEKLLHLNGWVVLVCHYNGRDS